MTSSDLPDSVRLALPVEAADIAALQMQVWAEEFADAPALLAELSEQEIAEAWHRAITRPPLAACRVLVAVSHGAVVGFATTMPSDDPDAAAGNDGLIAEFIIAPDTRGKGHGSRLLHACVDTLRADGFALATCWVRSTDDDLRAFLTDSGWAADGSHREIGLADGSVRLKQIRLHTDIAVD
ncbi:GNAT family N-acetyltransferase [Granulicoccus sp. GXG6511]|uniref:GNAT family N-acetyltransferase n=1 Tax=Granulicoccus sp. GXG6511 TaxID=3381351 RepID=UPI003D7E2624